MKASIKNKSMVELYKEQAARCYKLQKCRTSWRSTVKNQQPNDLISELHHEWNQLHDKSNQEICAFANYVQEMYSDGEEEEEVHDKYQVTSTYYPAKMLPDFNVIFKQLNYFFISQQILIYFIHDLNYNKNYDKAKVH